MWLIASRSVSWTTWVCTSRVTLIRHPRTGGGCLMVTARKRNPNGAATISRRKGGRYQAAVYGLQPDGTRARKFAYGKT